jgi:hypothetical protein
VEERPVIEERKGLRLVEHDLGLDLAGDDPAEEAAGVRQQR